MRIVVLGFTEEARDLVSKIKSFPEYKNHSGVWIYHIQVERNSLSYGPNLVVEIPDPHGDGYRTYNDGLQAVEDYKTTVSDYDEWFLKEAASGTFDTVIDFMEDREKSAELLEKLKEAMPESDGGTYYTNQTVDEVILGLRSQLDGGEPWTPVQFSEEFLEDAKIKAEEAAIEMERLHEVRREAMIKSRTDAGDRWCEGLFLSMEGCMSPDEISVVYDAVVNGIGGYESHDVFDSEDQVTIRKHEMLDWFVGPHKVLDTAMQMYITSDLELRSARYMKYESEDSFYRQVQCERYAEYILRQEKPWPILVGSSSTRLVEGDLYIGATNLDRDSLDRSGNSSVEILSFHFGPGECTCYDEVEQRAKELEFAKQGIACGQKDVSGY